MFDIILQILSVPGIILVVLLGLLLAVVLLVLFFPVTYRISGKKEGKELDVSARANWLFGLLRVRYAYPEPGKLTAKVLWYTVFASGAGDKGKTPGDNPGDAGKTIPQKSRTEKDTRDPGDAAIKSGDAKPLTEGEEGPPRGNSGKENREEGPDGQEGRKQQEREKQQEGQKQQEREKKQEGQKQQGQEKQEEGQEQQGRGKQEEGQEQQGRGKQEEGQEQQQEGKEQQEDGKQPADSQKAPRFLEKFTKIKYTILGIYDKIKRIWQNISYYVELLQEEETGLLFRHVESRLFKILKSIRPRKLKAQILFGTGSPDTTGYAYGVYGMLLPLLGSDVIVIPDFQQAALEGSFYAVGHVTAAVLLWHGLWVLLDRRLWLLRGRLKNKGKKQQKRKVSRA